MNLTFISHSCCVETLLCGELISELMSESWPGLHLISTELRLLKVSGAVSWGSRLTGVLNCVSEAALLVGVSAEVAEKRNTASGGRVIFKEGRFKRAESYLFLGGTIISPGWVTLVFFLFCIFDSLPCQSDPEYFFFQTENLFLLFSSETCEMELCSPFSKSPGEASRSESPCQDACGKGWDLLKLVLLLFC